MSYELIFRGKLVAGADPAAVRARLAAMFKISVERVEPLFDGQRRVLKKNLDQETAHKYRDALRAAGLIVAAVRAPGTQVEVPAQPGPTAAADDSGPSPTNSEAAQTSSDEAPGLAPVGVELIEKKVVAAPDISIEGLILDLPGAIMDESAPVQAPAIDTSSLATADSAEPLDSKPRPDAPSYDLSALTVDESGKVMDDSPRPQPAEIDISALSTTDTDEPLDGKAKAEKPEIRTDHLTVDE